jgi:hypothetical protein
MVCWQLREANIKAAIEMKALNKVIKVQQLKVRVCERARIRRRGCLHHLAMFSCGRCWRAACMVGCLLPFPLA